MGLINHNESMRNNKLRDECLVKKLCYRLDIGFNNIIGFNPNFKQHGGLESNHYKVYESSGYNSSSGINTEFSFAINYLDSEEILTKDEMESDFDDEELELILDERRDLTSVFIEYVMVQPHDQGIGTLLFNELVKRIRETRELKNISKIYLHPKNIRAEKFWRKLGFRNFAMEDLKDKTHLKMCGFLIFDLQVLIIHKLNTL